MANLSATDPRVDKLYVDMYLGAGKDDPPMTVRVDRLEQCILQQAESAQKTEQNSKDTRRMMLGTMLTVIGGFALMLAGHILGWKV